MTPAWLTAEPHAISEVVVTSANCGVLLDGVAAAEWTVVVLAMAVVVTAALTVCVGSFEHPTASRPMMTSPAVHEASDRRIGR